MYVVNNGKFLHHTSCPRCGSSDANAIYDDGGEHCFSCGRHMHGKTSGYVLAKEVDESDPVITIPDDISHEYSQVCLDWVDQYDLKAVDLIRHNVKWSRKFNQLIFYYQHMDKPIIACSQARNFTAGRTKYFNQGDVNNVLPIYYYSKPMEASRLVLVEDAISAIKVSKDVWVDAMPLLGSHLPIHKLSKIPNKGYTDVSVWLDHDKYREALDIGDRLRYLGLTVRVIKTPSDPKFHNSDEIARKVGLVS